MNLPVNLYHYYEIEQGPFKNITQNEFDKALEIQKNISVGFNSKRPSNYIKLRFAVEKRLKQAFVVKGGIPKIDAPFYFTLGECPWLKSCYDNPGVIKIPLSNFKKEYISFTYPDSMISFQIHDEPKLSFYKKSYYGKVYLLNEMIHLINQYGLPSEKKWQNQEAMKYDRYIEAQVWDDFIINQYKI
ncbi:hypothetical protein [uncultured Algibacter sp.]|uniref:hypothetical protein n=1 Tax=uncultured Algibacter sp. TaxID=298659 RepID=UPI0032162513